MEYVGVSLNELLRSLLWQHESSACTSINLALLLKVDRFTAAPQPVKEKIPGLEGTQIRPAREIPPAPEAASKPGITPNPPMCRTETDQRFFFL